MTAPQSFYAVARYGTTCYVANMNSIDEQIRRAQAAVSNHAITRKELAFRAGLRPSTLTGMLLPTWNPTRATLSAIVDVLDGIGFFCQTTSKEHVSVEA